MKHTAIIAMELDAPPESVAAVRAFVDRTAQQLRFAAASGAVGVTVRGVAGVVLESDASGVLDALKAAAYTMETPSE